MNNKSNNFIIKGFSSFGFPITCFFEFASINSNPPFLKRLFKNFANIIIYAAIFFLGIKFNSLSLFNNSFCFSEDNKVKGGNNLS